MAQQKLNQTTLPKDLSLAESFDVFMVNEFSLPSFAVRFLNANASSYEARDDDIYVVSYPKTGTTWVQEIVLFLTLDLNFESEKAVNIHSAFPYLEHLATNYEHVKAMTSPRLIKTHCPYSLLPESIKQKNCKMIYITRNPKDVVVSYYHFACWLQESSYKGSFSQFFTRFMRNRTTYSPFSKHNLEFWEHRNENNILFLFYEDLLKDPVHNVQKIADFLGKSISSDGISKVIDHCSFKNMAVRRGAGTEFFRKGKVGDWKNYFTPEQSLEMDKSVEEALKGTGLQYTYE